MSDTRPQPQQLDDYVLIPAYDWSDIRMLHWAKYWSLMAGGRVGCTRCAATQPASSNFEPFVHLEICPSWGWRDQYPWTSLREIMSGLPTEKFNWPM